jgi:hypothetical protein
LDLRRRELIEETEHEKVNATVVTEPREKEGRGSEILGE